MAGMRVFVALGLPGHLRDQLEEFVESRRDSDRHPLHRTERSAEWSWTIPEQWHLTLAFAGEVSQHQLERWEDHLADLAERTDPLELRIRGAGAFPHPDAAKVLWAGVEGPLLDELAARVRTAASRAGVRIDGQRFVPHLTMARSRRGVSALRWVRVFDTVELGPWPVEQIDLVESQWAGPRHRAVHHVVSRHRLGAGHHHQD